MRAQQHEAYDRHQLFADQLGHRSAGDAASVFASMAEDEDELPAL